jgi:hypothetical protein
VVVEEEEAEAVCGSHKGTSKTHTTCACHTQCASRVGHAWVALQTPDGNSLMLSPRSVWEAECHGGGGGATILLEGGREKEREKETHIGLR